MLPDGYVIYSESKLSGRNVYSWKNLRSNQKIVREQIGIIKDKFDSGYVNSQVDTMYDMIETNPNMAIGKAKELLETCSKTI